MQSLGSRSNRSGLTATKMGGYKLHVAQVSCIPFNYFKSNDFNTLLYSYCIHRCGGSCHCRKGCCFIYQLCHGQDAGIGERGGDMFYGNEALPQIILELLVQQRPFHAGYYLTTLGQTARSPEEVEWDPKFRWAFPLFYFLLVDDAHPLTYISNIVTMVVAVSFSSFPEPLLWLQPFLQTRPLQR